MVGMNQDLFVQFFYIGKTKGPLLGRCGTFLVFFTCIQGHQIHHCHVHPNLEHEVAQGSHHNPLGHSSESCQLGDQTGRCQNFVRREGISTRLTIDLYICLQLEYITMNCSETFASSMLDC